MFIKNYQLTFIFTLILGTMVAISANSWFTSWVGLEINLMSMIPLILIKLNNSLTESSIKYFLVQAMASLILILSFLFEFWTSTTMTTAIHEMMITASLALKAGMAPLHFWFPQVISNTDWTQSVILFTWQKIAPIMLLTSTSLTMITFIIAASAATGCLGGINQINLKVMLTYSSIAHSGWMLTACALNINSWSAYFLIYTILIISLISYFNKNNKISIKDITSNQETTLIKSMLILNILSLGGIPPLLGFTAKLTVLQILLANQMTTILALLILSSLVSLFYYCRIIYSAMMNNGLTPKILTKKNQQQPSTLLILTSLMNLISPALMILM